MSEDNMEFEEFIDYVHEEQYMYPSRSYVRDAMNPMEFYSNEEFRKRFRFRKETVLHAIMPLLCFKGGVNRGLPVPGILQLLVALKFYATGLFQIECGDLHKLSQSTVCKIVANISKQLALKLGQFIKFPQGADVGEVKRKFYEIASFPGVVGCIDCTHVPIKSPTRQHGEIFRNRKGEFSINVQLVCGPNLEIYDIVARWPGSVHDSRIFANSRCCMNFEEGNIQGLLLGDSGYAQTNYMYTPVLSPQSPAEERYNKAHILTRNTIERLNGVLKRKFACLSRKLQHKLENIVNIIVACAVLQNISVLNREEFTCVVLRQESLRHSITKFTIGAHLLLFFLAFVFGSFCTFCFHMLMYLFDEKCVLYPKLLSLSSLRHSIYDFLPDKAGTVLPVDFIGAKFSEKSACYLPIYVPLVSGIFGLVWTTMFLMCSSGSRSHSGLQRPWRVVPPVLVFSLAMSCLCIYTSAVTHDGLKELCIKLANATGSSSCTYTVNVATLAYERQIRGVYQATRLTISSAWMHTACWVASTVLAVARILLAVDFRLVQIRAELIGDIDKLLERNERQLRTIMPSPRYSKTSIGSEQKQLHFTSPQLGQLIDDGNDILFISDLPMTESDPGLVTEEKIKSYRMQALQAASYEHRFIVELLYDLLDFLDYFFGEQHSSMSIVEEESETLTRQYGQQELTPKQRKYQSADSRDTNIAIRVIKKKLMKRTTHKSDEDVTIHQAHENKPLSYDSELSITPELLQHLRAKAEASKPWIKIDVSKDDEKKPEQQALKSVLKTEDVAIQTEKPQKSRKKHKVTIASSKTSTEGDDEEGASYSKQDETTQTKPKEKQD